MSDSSGELIVRLCELLREHKARAPVAIRITEVSSVTDYFVIATGNSSTHLNALFRRALDFAKAEGYQPINALKQSGDAGWLLLDCGYFVVHLMNDELRSFYELERLWFHGETVYQTDESSRSGTASEGSAGENPSVSSN
jgi:ribosome-associated protein